MMRDDAFLAAFCLVRKTLQIIDYGEIITLYYFPSA